MAEDPSEAMSIGGYPLVIVAGCCEWHKPLLTNDHRRTKLLFRTSPETPPSSPRPRHLTPDPFTCTFPSLTRQDGGGEGGRLPAPLPPPKKNDDDPRVHLAADESVPLRPKKRAKSHHQMENPSSD